MSKTASQMMSQNASRFSSATKSYSTIQAKIQKQKETLKQLENKLNEQENLRQQNLLLYLGHRILAFVSPNVVFATVVGAALEASKIKEDDSEKPQALVELSSIGKEFLASQKMSLILMYLARLFSPIKRRMNNGLSFYIFL